MPSLASYLRHCLWLLWLPAATASAAPLPNAVLRGLVGTDGIGFSYSNLYGLPRSNHVTAGQAATVAFEAGGYTPTLVYFTTFWYLGRRIRARTTERPVLLLLPGDTVSVLFREDQNTFVLKGRHQAELDFCLRLWRGPLHLAGGFVEQGQLVGADSTVTYLGTGLVNHRHQPLAAYLGAWAALRREGDLRLTELRRTPGIRPEVAASLARHLQLRLFQLLLAPTRPWSRRDTLRPVPPAYADTVAAWARRLQPMQLLPPAAAQGLGAALAAYTRYQCVQAGHYPTDGTQYTQAKQTLTGFYRALVCFQILAEGRQARHDIRRWQQDYQKWVAPYEELARVLRGEAAGPSRLLPVAAFSDSVATPAGRPRHLTDVLATYRGRVLLLDVWASWCVPCREEMPRTAALARRLAGRGLAVAYLSIDEDPAAWRRALRQVPAGAHYRFQRPSASAFRQELELRAVPRYLLFGRDGILLNPDFLRPTDERAAAVLEKQL